MHYSDCYKLIKNIKDKYLAARLKSSLKNLEKEANHPSFVTYLKTASAEKSILELRKAYDIEQLAKVRKEIKNILQSLPKDDVDHAVLEVKNVLKNIKRTAKSQMANYDAYQENGSHYAQLAQKYATHFIPFNQSNDPFKSSDFNGYCWGHTHRYGKLASKGILDSLSVASDKKLYTTFKTNWTFADILFRRVGWYFAIRQELKIKEVIWNALKQLDEKSTFNFNFLINTWGFHSTALRMVGKGIEYYDNNYGLVKFKCREDAVNFLSAHLLHQAMEMNGKVSFVTVYKLPYENLVEHDIFPDLPQAAIKREETFSAEAERMPRSPKLRETLDALSNYASELENSKDIKAKIKANELRNLFTELESLPDSKLGNRLKEILETKEHSLMINRGTGFYFFASGCKSHSTTEMLLQAIYEAATTESIPSLVV
ncbi:hypothetical protein [Legionella cardiaca]|uniref:Dot/Icm T4SS effector n=1 Tax=Legionella cardiaca TaxID=1071983 RepID=A0ABY8AND7_9GAMM|nr:hypothetical protein [Legionella cardiaca]WED41771.1 hypothetical protein PXX05_07440 [Legionella cardiaca]